MEKWAHWVVWWLTECPMGVLAEFSVLPFLQCVTSWAAPTVITGTTHLAHSAPYHCIHPTGVCISTSLKSLVIVLSVTPYGVSVLVIWLAVSCTTVSIMQSLVYDYSHSYTTVTIHSLKCPHEEGCSFHSWQDCVRTHTSPAISFFPKAQPAQYWWNLFSGAEDRVWTTNSRSGC